MIISHNLLAMNAARMYNINVDTKKKSTEKLSSGFQINRAADDAAGLTISEKMRSMIRGLNQGTKNTQDGVSWIQVADGAMNEVHDMIHRMTELSVKACNGTLTDADRRAINKEIQQLINEVDRIDQSTQFNTKDIFLKGNISLSVRGIIDPDDPSKENRLVSDPLDLTMFNASYTKEGNLALGGFLFHGKRVSWDDIKSAGESMVKVVDGKQVFNGGIYSYEADDGTHFQLIAQDGEEPPMVLRKIELAADSEGLYIDGSKISWANVKDDDGVSIKDNIRPGEYKVEYGNAELTIKIGESIKIRGMNDIINSINSGNDGVMSYTWIANSIGMCATKPPIIAASVSDPIKDAKVLTDSLVNKSNCKNPTGDSDIQYTLHVEGWPKDDKNDEGLPKNVRFYLTGTLDPVNPIAGSEHIYTDLISDWYKDDPVAGKTFTYSDPTTEVKFNFNLSAFSGIADLIDALDGMKFIAGYNSHYDNRMVISDANSNIKDVNMGDVLPDDFDCEVKLDRKFDVAAAELGRYDVTYDETNHKLTFNIKGNGTHSADTLYEFSADTAKNETAFINTLKKMKNDASEAEQIKRALSRADGNGEVRDRDIVLAFTDELDRDEPMSARYTYALKDYEDKLAEWTSVKIEKAWNNQAESGLNHNDLSGYYVYSATPVNGNYYLNAKEYKENQTKAAINSILDEMDTVMTAFYTANPTASNADATNKFITDLTSKLQNKFSATAASNIINGLGAGFTYNAANKNNNRNSYGAALIGSINYNDISLNQSIYKMNIHKDNSKLADVENYSAFAKNAMHEIADKSEYVVETKDYTNTPYSIIHRLNPIQIAGYQSSIEIAEISTGILIQHSGVQNDYTIIPQFALNSTVLNLVNVDTSTAKQAGLSLGILNKALDYVSGKRTILGAVQNRLEHTLKNNANKAENTTAAESRIRDTDMATEVVKLTKQNILTQVGESMLAQANLSKQGVLAILG